MKKYISIAIMCVLLCISTAYAQPADIGEIGSAKAFLVIEGSTGEVISQQNSNEMLGCAGLTKLMSWLLIMEKIDSASDVSVSETAASQGGTRVFLDSGTKYPADQLLKASIMCSANDATVALAESLFGSEDALVSAMNERAEQMGIDAVFVDSTGLSDENMMSASAIAQICAQLAAHNEFFTYSKLYLETFTHESGRETEMVNPNRLVRTEEIDGMATGSSVAAGYGVAASMKSGSGRFFCVVLGASTSDDRFNAATLGLNYASSAYVSKNIAREGEKISSIEIPGSNEGKIDALAAQDFDVLVKKGEDVETKIELFEPILPILEGQEIGTLTAILPGGDTAQIPLLAGSDAVEKSYGYCLELILKDWLRRN